MKKLIIILMFFIVNIAAEDVLWDAALAKIKAEEYNKLAEQAEARKAIITEPTPEPTFTNPEVQTTTFIIGDGVYNRTVIKDMYGNSTVVLRKVN